MRFNQIKKIQETRHVNFYYDLIQRTQKLNKEVHKTSAQIIIQSIECIVQA